MYLDIITDADGSDNTIDTANTTALFNVSKYENRIIGGATTDHIWTNSFSQTGNWAHMGGMRFSSSTDTNLYSVTKQTSNTCTTVALRSTSGGANIATATYTGNVATFSTPVAITASTNYWVVHTETGTQHTYQGSGSSFPTTSNGVTFDLGLNPTTGTEDAQNGGYDISSIQTIGLVINDTIVQTNAQSITANPTAHQLFCHSSIAGTGAITYNISFDGGTTWVTDQALNNKNTSVHAGSSMVLKINLDGTGAGNTSETPDYALMLFY